LPAKVELEARWGAPAVSVHEAIALDLVLRNTGDAEARVPDPSTSIESPRFKVHRQGDLVVRDLGPMDAVRRQAGSVFVRRVEPSPSAVSPGSSLRATTDLLSMTGTLSAGRYDVTVELPLADGTKISRRLEVDVAPLSVDEVDAALPDATGHGDRALVAWRGDGKVRALSVALDRSKPQPHDALATIEAAVRSGPRVSRAKAGSGSVDQSWVLWVSEAGTLEARRVNERDAIGAPVSITLTGLEAALVVAVAHGDVVTERKRKGVIESVSTRLPARALLRAMHDVRPALARVGIDPPSPPAVAPIAADEVGDVLAIPVEGGDLVVATTRSGKEWRLVAWTWPEAAPAPGAPVVVLELAGPPLDVALVGVEGGKARVAVLARDPEGDARRVHLLDSTIEGASATPGLARALATDEPFASPRLFLDASSAAFVVLDRRPDGKLIVIDESSTAATEWTDRDAWIGALFVVEGGSPRLARLDRERGFVLEDLP
jgi:hypothetical protein